MVEVYDDLIFVEMIGFEVGVHVDTPWKINGCNQKNTKWKGKLSSIHLHEFGFKM